MFKATWCQPPYRLYQDTLTQMCARTHVCRFIVCCRFSRVILELLVFLFFVQFYKQLSFTCNHLVYFSFTQLTHKHVIYQSYCTERGRLNSNSPLNQPVNTLDENGNFTVIKAKCVSLSGGYYFFQKQAC